MTEMTVVIEHFLEENPNKVCVYKYDGDMDTVYMDLEVCSKDEAFNKYNVVGEIRNGTISLYNKDDIEDEELDMYDEDFEEYDDE